jgi:glycosyltransferase involved in cell wall biosynthesis
VRIDYVTETWPPEINGAALTTAHTVQHLRACGHAVRVVRPRQPHETARDDDEEWRCAVTRVPMVPDLRLGWATPSSLRARWQRRAPELVHVATPGPLGWSALRAAQSVGLPCSADFRAQLDRYAAHYGLAWARAGVAHYLRCLHAAADLTFVPTTALLKRLADQGFERLAVIGRGVDANTFHPQWRSDALRRSWGAERSDTVGLYVGRLAAEKEPQRALDLFERWRGCLPGFRCVVVGDGPLRAALQRRHPHVRFLGSLRGAALSQAYASADVFLFPSRSETFGNVVLEAAASGLVVVAHDSAAAHRHLRDRISACLARGESAMAFDEAALRGVAVARLASHPMRTLARQAALAADWPEVLARFEAQLRALVWRARTNAAIPARQALT